MHSSPSPSLSLPLNFPPLSTYLTLFLPAVIITSLSFLLPLQELLAEVNHRHVKNTVCQKVWRLLVHALAWAICMAGTAACVLGIYFFSNYMHQVRSLVSFPCWPQYFLSDAFHLTEQTAGWLRGCSIINSTI